MILADLVNLLKNTGVVGAGGAGFPSYAKLSDRADTIILNCAECEPILTLHRQVLEKHSYEIVSTLSLIVKMVGAERGIVALKKSYSGAVAAVETTKVDFDNIEIKFLPEEYPSGDEVVTIYETTGRVVPPGSIPISVGVTVFNVETVFNIYNAINKNKPVTHKYVTIAGEVKEPKTVYAPIGIEIKKLIDCAGGTTVSEFVLINGGPMMGRECGIYDTVTKTTNGILVLPKDHYIINRKHSKTNIDIKRAMSSCCQCRMCTDLCPRNLLGHPIDPSAFMHAASSGTIRKIEPMLNTFYCSSCGLCEMYSCMQGLSPRSMIAAYKTGLRENGVKPPENPKQKPVRSMRKFRGVSKERLTSRIGLSKYDVDAPLSDEKFNAETYKIMLSQHIGAPAKAVVSVGDKVKAEQLIACAAENGLSVNIHSSTDGEVTAVSEKNIIIRGDGK